MRTTKMVLLAAVSLFPAACGGDGGGEQAAPADGAPVASVAPADVEALGGQLDEAGWSCSEMLVDMAGYEKVTCGIPDELMSPGMVSNAVAVHGWSEPEHVDVFREMYLPEDRVLVVGEGWFLMAPNDDVASAAADVLGG